MKPQPPTSLLLADQTWVVVESKGWVPDDGYQCSFLDSRVRCTNQAVAAELSAEQRHRLCVKHMGYHRWRSEDDRIVQWRADPPFTDYHDPIHRPRRRKGE